MDKTIHETQDAAIPDKHSDYVSSYYGLTPEHVLYYTGTSRVVYATAQASGLAISAYDAQVISAF